MNSVKKAAQIGIVILLLIILGAIWSLVIGRLEFVLAGGSATSILLHGIVVWVGLSVAFFSSGLVLRAAVGHVFGIRGETTWERIREFFALRVPDSSRETEERSK